MARKHVCRFGSASRELDIGGRYVRSYQAQNDGIIIPSKLFRFPSDLTTECNGSGGQYTQDDAAGVEIWDPGMLEVGNSQPNFRIGVPQVRCPYQEFDPIRIESSSCHGRNGWPFARRKAVPVYSPNDFAIISCVFVKWTSSTRDISTRPRLLLRKRWGP